MKKLLAILSVFSLTVTTSTGVISCNILKDDQTIAGARANITGKQIELTLAFTKLNIDIEKLVIKHGDDIIAKDQYHQNVDVNLIIDLDFKIESNDDTYTLMYDNQPPIKVDTSKVEIQTIEGAKVEDDDQHIDLTLGKNKKMADPSYIKLSINNVLITNFKYDDDNRQVILLGNNLITKYDKNVKIRYYNEPEITVDNYTSATYKTIKNVSLDNNGSIINISYYDNIVSTNLDKSLFKITKNGNILNSESDYNLINNNTQISLNQVINSTDKVTINYNGEFAFELDTTSGPNYNIESAKLNNDGHSLLLQKTSNNKINPANISISIKPAGAHDYLGINQNSFTITDQDNTAILDIIHEQALLQGCAVKIVETDGLTDQTIIVEDKDKKEPKLSELIKSVSAEDTTNIIKIQFNPDFKLVLNNLNSDDFQIIKNQSSIDSDKFTVEVNSKDQSVDLKFNSEKINTGNNWWINYLNTDKIAVNITPHKENK